MAVTTDGNAQTFTPPVDAFEPSRRYFIRVAAGNGNGDGAQSAIHTFVTHEIVHAPVFVVDDARNETLVLEPGEVDGVNVSCRTQPLGHVT